MAAEAVETPYQLKDLCKGSESENQHRKKAEQGKEDLGSLL